MTYVIKLTPQQAYDQIREYFAREGAVLAKTENPGELNGCWYRSPNGAKCAVGCLIPDEAYNSKMEDHTLSSLVFEGLVSIPSVRLEEFLRKAQAKHDTSNSVEDFISRLDSLAPNFNIKVPI